MIAAFKTQKIVCQYKESGWCLKEIRNDTFLQLVTEIGFVHFIVYFPHLLNWPHFGLD